MKPLPIAPLLFLLALGGGLLVLGLMAAPAQPVGAPAPPVPSTTSGPPTQASTDEARVSALSGHSHDEAPAPRPICLRIVDRKGVPVADADVVFAGEASRDRESVPASPVTRRSDREGFVDLQALPGEPMQAEARKGTLHGTLQFDPTDWTVPDNVLVVDTDKDLHILVVDDRDRPQPGIRVLVEALTRPRDEDDCWQRIAALETDDRGMAVVRHVHDVAYWSVDGHRCMQATIAMMGVPSTPLALRLDEVGTAPITLHCPSNGRLHVRKWQRPGVRSTLETRVLVRQNDQDEPVDHWLVDGRLPEDVIAAPLGRDWRMRTMLHSEALVRGPRSTGEVVFVDLYEKPATWFVLHVQGADGTPLAHHLLVDPAELNPYVSAWTTDAEGRLRLPHHFHSVSESPARSRLLADASGRPVGVVAWRLPKCDEEPARDIDLGAVRIQPLTRRVRGVVLDAATQQPIAKARCGARTSGADLPLHRTDASGRFELLVVAGAPLELWANAPGHAATHIELSGETSELELTLKLAAEAERGAVRSPKPAAESMLGAAVFLAAPQAGVRFVEASFVEVFRATLPLGIELPLIVVPENGLPEGSVLRGGLTKVDWSESPTCSVVVHGLPEGLPNDRLQVQPYLLTRNEPLLDELARAGAGGSLFAAPTHELSSLQTREDEERAEPCTPVDLADGAATARLRWRGRYAFLLQVRNDDGEWNSVYQRNPEHVDISAGGARTIELVVDPAQVRALL
ncbi:MAG: carboxypeptidase-like regulatory domain-containing protein [Planctomycetota bacterium]